MQNIILQCAIKAALLAGQDILDVYNDPNADFNIERKADNSPLTIADRLSHKRIASLLKETPYPILSEEGKLDDYQTRKEWNILWIVDPLDGTKEFIKRNGEFTVNIALVKDSKPVLGVIYVPVTRELYFAEETTGAYKINNIDSSEADNDLKTLISQAAPLPLPQSQRHFTIVASRSHLSPETESYIEKLKQIHSDVDLISSGSSLKICRVAEGNADAYQMAAMGLRTPTKDTLYIMESHKDTLYMVSKDIIREVPQTQYSVYFATGKSELQSTGLIDIAHVAEAMIENENMIVHVHPYYDRSGSKEFNLKLGRERAERIKYELVYVWGIDASRIRTYEAKVLLTKDDKLHYQPFRRCDMILEEVNK